MYEIREFKTYDTESIIDFIIKIQRNEYNININLDDQTDLLKIDESYINDGGNFWVAQDQFGEIIGTLGVQRLSKNRGALKKMFVHSAYRSKKIGKSLINYLFQYCEDNKINEIYLGTTDKFKDAQIFYKKNGFKEISINELPKDFPTLEVDNRFYKKKISSRLYSPYQLHISQRVPELGRKDRI